MPQDNSSKLVQGTVTNKGRAPVGLAGENHKKPILIPVGSTFEGRFYMTKRAAALIEKGALSYEGKDVATGGEPAPAQAPAPAPTGVTQQATNASADVLKSVLPKLGAEDFTDDGKPKVDAVNKALPFGPTFTSGDRDTAWAELQAQ